MGRWIDISMAITDGLRTNHSLPGEEARITHDVSPEVDPNKRKTVRRLSARLHTGTHVDAPEHLVLGGKRLDEFPIDSFVGRAWVVDMYHKVPAGMIGPAELEDAAGEKVRAGDILIIRTGWNSHFREPDFFTGSPYLHPESADWCIDKKLKMVVVDFMTDPTVKERQIGGSDAFKVRALGAGVLVLTNADNLDKIEKEQVTLYAFPIKVTPSDACPTRAVVWED